MIESNFLAQPAYHQKLNATQAISVFAAACQSEWQVGQWVFHEDLKMVLV